MWARVHRWFQQNFPLVTTAKRLRRWGRMRWTGRGIRERWCSWVYVSGFGLTVALVCSDTSFLTLYDISLPKKKTLWILNKMLVPSQFSNYRWFIFKHFQRKLPKYNWWQSCASLLCLVWKYNWWFWIFDIWSEKTRRQFAQQRIRYIFFCPFNLLLFFSISPKTVTLNKRWSVQCIPILKTTLVTRCAFSSFCKLYLSKKWINK